jgi:hypothetical protein
MEVIRGWRLGSMLCFIRTMFALAQHQSLNEECDDVGRRGTFQSGATSSGGSELAMAANASADMLSASLAETAG